METCSAGKPHKPVVEAAFLQIAVDLRLLRRKVARHHHCQQYPLPLPQNTSSLLRYLPDMNLGVRKGMAGIQQQARLILAQQGQIWLQMTSTDVHIQIFLILLRIVSNAACNPRKFLKRTCSDVYLRTVSEGEEMSISRS